MVERTAHLTTVELLDTQSEPMYCVLCQVHSQLKYSPKVANSHDVQCMERFITKK